MMFVTLKEKNHRPVSPKTKKPFSQQEIMGLIRSEIQKINGVQRVIVRDPSLSALSTGRGFPIEISLRGGNLEKLGELTAQLIKKMEESKLMSDIDTDYLTGMPEINIIPDREKAALRGVAVSAIAQNIQAYMGGVRAGKYTYDGKRYDIRLQTKKINRQSKADFQKIWIRNNRGELVRLSDVIKIEERKTLLTINRKDRERTIGIFANVVPGQSQAQALDFVMKSAKEILPAGYRVLSTGSSQGFQESFNSLYFALIVGIFVAYMVLASQFNSFLHPIYVLLALPFSVTGAFLALKFTGYTLNLYSMIGLLLLMGIVKKNSILLVDFTNEKRKAGLTADDALLAACPVRLRPILMTSIATIAAAIPPAISVGPGAETSAPMAVVIIGGVLLSTILTLFVVPSAYSLFAKFEGHGHDGDLKQALIELGEAPKDHPTQA
jgi:HAE1 family hydrophobic/amphiphilic exporter-1